MQLIAIVIIGALLGFIYGYNTDGIIFTTDICLFAGLTLIMPSLFNIQFKDIHLIWEYKRLLLKSFGINFVILPLIALGIGFWSDDFGIMGGLFLISVLSGGGMVMHWIKKSNADTSLGFLLLFINLLLVSFSLWLLHIFGLYTAPHFGIAYDSEITVSRFAWQVMLLLIIIPFLASRVVLLFKPLVRLIQTHPRVMSRTSIFIILFYLFGLQDSQQLIDIYDFEPELFGVAFIAVVGFYLLVFIVAKLSYNLNSPQERAVFWHSITRYLTLALVISTFTASTFGVSMLLPIMFAYLVQIPMAVVLNHRYM